MRSTSARRRTKRHRYSRRYAERGIIERACFLLLIAQEREAACSALLLPQLLPDQRLGTVGTVWPSISHGADSLIEDGV